MFNTFSGTRDSFLTLLPSSLCPSSVVSVVLFTFWFHRIGFLCKRNSKKSRGMAYSGERVGLKRRFYSSTCWFQSINIYMCIEIVIIYISIDVSSMKLFLIAVFWKWYVGISLAYVLFNPGTWWASLHSGGFMCVRVCVCVQKCFLYVFSATAVQVGRASGPHEGT